MTLTKYSQLSPQWKRLIRILQSTNYGSILNLAVVNGEPCFKSEPGVLKDVRLDEDVPPRTEIDAADFELPVEVRRLLAQLKPLTNGSVEKIVVHGGLPRRVTLRCTVPEVRL